MEGLFLHNKEPKYFSLASGTNSTKVAQQSMKCKRGLHLNLRFSRLARSRRATANALPAVKFRYLEWNRCGVMKRLHCEYCPRSGALLFVHVMIDLLEVRHERTSESNCMITSRQQEIFR